MSIPNNRSRSLFTVWVTTDAFAQFFAVSDEEALKELGPAGYRKMMPADVDAFVGSLDRLLGDSGEGSEHSGFRLVLAASSAIRCVGPPGPAGGQAPAPQEDTAAVVLSGRHLNRHDPNGK